MRDVQGTLSARVERLSDAFDALLELVEIRAQLMSFAPAATVRLAARRYLASVAPGADAGPSGRERESGGASAPKAEDITGYWLPPALDALYEMAKGGDAKRSRETAQSRDVLRSNLFWILAVGAGYGGEARLPEIKMMFPERADEEVTRGARLVWMAAAEGRLGIPGRLAVGKVIDDAREKLRPATAGSIADEWVSSLTGIPLPAPIEIPAPLTVEDAAPLVAAARLEILASWCAGPKPHEAAEEEAESYSESSGDADAKGEGAEGHKSERNKPGKADGNNDAKGEDGKPAGITPPSQAGAPRAPREEEHSVLLLPSTQDEEDPEDDTDAVAQLLRFLVEEGSPAEWELLERDSYLRSVAAGAKPEALAALDDGVGTLNDLLRADALGPHQAERSLALWVGRAYVLRAAERLLASARSSPADQVKVSVDGAKIVVGTLGVSQSQIDKAVESAAKASIPDTGSKNPITRRREDQERAKAESDVGPRLEAAANRASRVLKEHQARCQEAADSAVTAAARIRQALGPVPTI